MIRSVYLLFFVGLLLLLAGCGDRLELEEQAYVVVLGIDMSPQDHLFEVTFQIGNPQVGSTETASSQTEPASDIISFVASDITSAKELANSVITRKMTFSHLHAIIIGEELARTPFFHQLISSSAGDPEIRREVNLIVSKEKAVDFINKNKPELETRPHKYYVFMQKRWRDTGHVPISNMNRYFQRVTGELFLAAYATTERIEELHKDEDAYVAGRAPQHGGDPVQMIGSAVFKQGRMIGTLNGEETRLALFLRRKAFTHTVIATVPDPLHEQYRITVRLLKYRSTDIKVNLKGKTPEIYVSLPLKVQVLSIPSLTDYVLDEKKRTLLTQSIHETLNKQVMYLIEKTQTEFQNEPFLWSLEVRKKFWTLKDYHDYDWAKHYANAKIVVNFDIEIDTFGKQFKPSRVGKR